MLIIKIIRVRIHDGRNMLILISIIVTALWAEGIFDLRNIQKASSSKREKIGLRDRVRG
jgi:hypothetical protein